MKKLFLSVLIGLFFNNVFADTWYVSADVPWIWISQSGEKPGPLYYAGHTVGITPPNTGNIVMSITNNGMVSAQLTTQYGIVCNFIGQKTDNHVNGNYVCIDSVASLPWQGTISQ